MPRRTLALLVLAAAPCAVARENPAAPAPPPSATRTFEYVAQVRLRGDTYRDLDLTSERFGPGELAKSVRGDDDALGASASLLFAF
ncbi:MAG TPA: hypothetical protein PLP50_05445 [Thermoanaerobaculia bacterium]|nr:hypothetical protein [Thermoanaerobaculia bacterium]HQN06259.1 hypothetical protein [Thermoanaerobaculia bacterium]HQP86096.1 hypothetical protein [Thermoanaerobaculia bacterium]